MASLGTDLARIRKERELSLQELHEATKIPMRILRSIEDDSIFTDLDENATYIRSYVRGYAKALSIDDRQIIHALDKREKNAYAGSLQKILDNPPEESSDSETIEEKESSAPNTQPKDDSKGEMVHDHSPEFQSDSKTKSSSRRTTPRSTSPDRSEIRSVDWADIGQRFRPLQSFQPKTIIGAGFLLVIILVGSYFLFFNSADENTGSNDQQASAVKESSAATSQDEAPQLNLVPETTKTASDTVDSEQTDTLIGISQQNQPLEALPDTLEMIVYAAYGRLEPVRVYTDIMDSINPYWIEQGDAMRFEFVNEIRIRGTFDNITLILNGHVVENFREQFYNDQTRLVEITRSAFEGESRWLQPAPDSLTIEAPNPDTIRARPTFN